MKEIKRWLKSYDEWVWVVLMMYHVLGVWLFIVYSWRVFGVVITLDASISYVVGLKSRRSEESFIWSKLLVLVYIVTGIVKGVRR